MKRTQTIIYNNEVVVVTLYSDHWFFDIPPMNWGVFKQFIAITIFKYILFRNRMFDSVIKHELFHVEQQCRECCAVMFYIKYGIKFVINFLFKYPFQFRKSYHQIDYEIEAYNSTH